MNGSLFQERYKSRDVVVGAIQLNLNVAAV